jgi:hypothetical protein
VTHVLRFTDFAYLRQFLAISLFRLHRFDANHGDMLAFRLVTYRGANAANELWPAFPKRREIAVTCIGSYTRIVLTMSDERPPLEPQPRWA